MQHIPSKVRFREKKGVIDVSTWGWNIRVQWGPFWSSYTVGKTGLVWRALAWLWGAIPTIWSNLQWFFLLFFAGIQIGRIENTVSSWLSLFWKSTFTYKETKEKTCSAKKKEMVPKSDRKNAIFFPRTVRYTITREKKDAVTSSPTGWDGMGRARQAFLPFQKGVKEMEEERHRPTQNIVAHCSYYSIGKKAKKLFFFRHVQYFTSVLPPVIFFAEKEKKSHKFPFSSSSILGIRWLSRSYSPIWFIFQKNGRKKRRIYQASMHAEIES